MKDSIRKITCKVLLLYIFFIGICFTSCVTLTNQYKDNLGEDKSFWITYYNTDLAFSTNYNSDYDIQIEQKNWKSIKLPKQLRRTIKPVLKKGGELLYWGKTNTSPFFYTASILYPKNAKFSEKQLLNQNFDKKIVQVNNQEINRYIYETESLGIVDYFGPIKEHLLRVFFIVDNNLGFSKDDFVFIKSKEKLLLHEASSLFENWYQTTNNLVLENKPPTSPFVLAQEAFDFKTGNYLNSILALKKHEAYYDSIGFFDFYCQAMGTYQSFAGNADRAKLYFDKRFEKFIKQPRDTISSDIFNNYGLTQAKNYLLERSKNEQVIMFNEAHHRPEHRAFISSILPDLYKQGFKYLALEALDYSDTLLQGRGYPVISSGFYTKEPAFGNLIRIALSLGFHVFPYENREDCQNTTSNPHYCNTKRDSNQAINILKVLEKEPQAKLIVLAGYQHIEEKSRTKWVTMAQHFQNLTGINPLTIDQTKMIGKSNSRFENKYYSGLNNQLKINEPSVLLETSSNEVWKTPNSREYVDVQIVHPRQIDYNSKIEVTDLLDGISLEEFPVIIQLFATKELEKEGKQAIPLFNKILYSQETEVYSHYPNVEKTTIVIRGKTGDILHENELQIN